MNENNNHEDLHRIGEHETTGEGAIGWGCVILLVLVILLIVLIFVLKG